MADLRRVMSAFATGVTVITVSGDQPGGMTANAFCSVSLDPPLALCCVSRESRLHEALSADGRFAVSVLNADQEHVARHFADHARPHGWAQFDALEWFPGPHTGAPLLTGALGWLECEVAQEVPAGDHSVFIGGVLDAVRGADLPALVFLDGAFQKSSRASPGLGEAPAPRRPPGGVRGRDRPAAVGAAGRGNTWSTGTRHFPDG
ncbi:MULTISPECIES: flavin reductase family protein [Nocardiopsis]|uniref:Flavin reductase n=1 Tax=Nocardiopsis sinuspersici TaxID=501010 RepID=A0A1V3BYK3_9ACTN|nr:MULTISPECIES: flavin reductase family protein [Nocardiopsis]OOC53326.1 flavin reductase [Nocardiopsis sinuspersici]